MRPKAMRTRPRRRRDCRQRRLQLHKSKPRQRPRLCASGLRAFVLWAPELLRWHRLWRAIRPRRDWWRRWRSWTSWKILVSRHLQWMAGLAPWEPAWTVNFLGCRTSAASEHHWGRSQRRMLAGHFARKSAISSWSGCFPVLPLKAVGRGQRSDGVASDGGCAVQVPPAPPPPSMTGMPALGSSSRRMPSCRSLLSRQWRSCGITRRRASFLARRAPQ
mmetsp:Transcript_30183/g.86451  ORF Transcript_30183/g.86451 Transcript_30183/m.86451 type:complete len:218 (+) Transcript_30183:839-1492(+)